MIKDITLSYRIDFEVKKMLVARCKRLETDRSKLLRLFAAWFGKIDKQEALRFWVQMVEESDDT